MKTGECNYLIMNDLASIILITLVALLGCEKNSPPVQYVGSNENRKVGFLENDCRTISDYFSENTIDASSVEVRQGQKKNYTINDPVKIKALLDFIKNNSESWCKPTAYTAPSGDSGFTIYSGKKSLISFQVGRNFIGLGWYSKNLSEEKIKVLRNLIQE